MNKLWLKLTTAFLFVALLVVVVIAVMANRVTITGFRRFLDEDRSDQAAPLVSTLERYYADNDGWAGVEVILGGYLPGHGAGGGGSTLIVLDETGQIVATAGGGRGRTLPDVQSEEVFPILVNSQRVGGLVVDEPGMMGGRAAEEFLADVNQVILLTALAAVILALLLGAVLSRSLTRPLSQLIQATRAVASGDLDQQVVAKSDDEFGELATSFNQMASALAANEVQRQQLFADLAHELRTPISVIQGQVEAIQDGIFDSSPENLAIVHEETIILGRLVEELRALSLADSGQLPLDKAPLDLGLVVKQVVTALEPLADAEGIKVSFEVGSSIPPVMADSGRIQQVLSNLLSNALRHARQNDRREPTVLVNVEVVKNGVRVTVEDSGPGLTAESLEHAFDRFWRADTARNRDQGGSGLGLAICKGIIDAHGGRIWVESFPGEGASFKFELPASDST
jgi:two-component system OmpR family sensor kinase/two-component system sensor histidine kinase BaeS